jgi:aspartate racemase
VLGCTELPLIVRPIDSVLPTFDTTALHALAAVEFSLSQ